MSNDDLESILAFVLGFILFISCILLGALIGMAIR